LLINILDPNREVAPDFVSYDVTLKDRSGADGIIATANAEQHHP